MAAYYNEFDPFAAEWLRELIRDGLIAPGDVDSRDIREVAAADLAGYTQCHFFAGIGGWSAALRLAGWSDDRKVWTGSCPCQPFSAAGKRKGVADDRHLWPDWFRLVRECRPVVVFGEQVEGAVKHGWLDGVSADLEGESYAVGSAVLGAHSVGAPHQRQRLYWVADADGGRGKWRRSEQPREGGSTAEVGTIESRRRSSDGSVGDAECERVRGGGYGSDVGAASRVQGADGERQRVRADAGAASRVGVALGAPNGEGLQGYGRLEQVGDAAGWEEPRRHGAASSGDDGSVGDADGTREGAERRVPEGARVERPRSFGAHWRDFRFVHCRDGKARRVPTEPRLFPLADGIPNRVALLRGAGNAIVTQVAAEFVAAYRDVIE